MGKLVLRSDLVTLKETTTQIKSDLGISLDEAADIVLAILNKSESLFQFWEIPSKGLPYKAGEPRRWKALKDGNDWLGSRWWDQEHLKRQGELRTLAGVRYCPDDRIEDIALLRRDAYRLLLSDLYDEFSERLHTPTPKNKLVQVTELLAAISDFSGGKVQISELACTFSHAYDGDKIMIYESFGDGWLCEPINEGGYSGFNKRVSIVDDFSQAATYERLGFNYEHDQYLILKEDAASIAQQLWMKFFDQPMHDPLVSLGLTEPASKPGQATTTEKNERIEANLESDIDPADLPDELHAANIAFRAVTNGHGDKYATFKNRLIDYLEKNFTDLSDDAIKRISTVANPNKLPGRKKQSAE